MSEKETEAIFITSGISYQWLDEKHLLKFVLVDVSRETVDKWYNFLTEVLQNWPVERPYRVLYDMRRENVTFTPYIREKAGEINALRPEVKGRIAIVLKPNATAYLVRLFARVRRRSSRVTALFFTEEEALLWLRESIE